MSLGFVRRSYTVLEGGEVEVCVRITSLPNSTLPEGIDVFLSTADGSAGVNAIVSNSCAYSIIKNSCE